MARERKRLERQTERERETGEREKWGNRESKRGARLLPLQSLTARSPSPGRARGSTDHEELIGGRIEWRRWLIWWLIEEEE